ncbi:MAG: hypothetical protein AAFU61_03375, partial [Pseudomonadota bacterium]
EGGAVELNAARMFIYGMGAILSPLIATELIQRYGPGAMFAFIAAAHAALAGYGLWRMTRRGAPAERKPYRYLPRTSFVLSRLLGRRR